ncbi:hypothetical protein TorRG33x02_206670 [Trema orientale]|uniref:Uncharacterized protein n=1 Tax=Trema orientale TaxID=63057 RepID=A0A2P5EDA9_TREOI|nr:hypothetical protein TorRG33x02_206670 [Trema orientale]
MAAEALLQITFDDFPLIWRLAQSLECPQLSPSSSSQKECLVDAERSGLSLHYCFAFEIQNWVGVFWPATQWEPPAYVCQSKTDF